MAPRAIERRKGGSAARQAAAPIRDRLAPLVEGCTHCLVNEGRTPGKYISQDCLSSLWPPFPYSLCFALFVSLLCFPVAAIVIKSARRMGRGLLLPLFRLASSRLFFPTVSLSPAFSATLSHAFRPSLCLALWTARARPLPPARWCIVERRKRDPRVTGRPENGRRA